MHYRMELNQRYWEYLKTHFANRNMYFERPNNNDGRPPVFIKKEAWRNVLINPNASQEEKEEIIRLVPESKRHMWFRSMNSSQALAQSIFGNLVVYGRLEKLIGLKDDDGNGLFEKAIVASNRFLMENSINYLGEPRPTSLDGYIHGEYRIAIECKFAESDVGTCSRPNLKEKKNPNYETEFCNGTYSKQRNRKERCSLSEIGVKYWHYIPQILNWKRDRDYNPCPLKNNYQLVRNILAVCVTPDGKVSTNAGHVIVIYDERNPQCQKEGKIHSAFIETKKVLQNNSVLRKCNNNGTL